MMNRVRGIALIDLLVLVALISILAAIFIPQMAVFAVRSYNAAAVADLRTAAVAQETLKANFGVYGRSSSEALPGSGGYGSGTLLIGPGNPSYPNILTATDDLLTLRGIAVQLSNDVYFQSDTHWEPGSTTYTMLGKHLLGDAVFAMEPESKAIYMQKNPVWIGFTISSTGVWWSVTTAQDLTVFSFWQAM